MGDGEAGSKDEDLEHLPVGCPPDDAVPPDGDFFRLTARNLSEGDVPGAEDWQLPFEKRKGDCAGRSDVCSCRAHSVFTDRSDVDFARAASPWARRKSVSRLKLEPDCGKVVASESEILPSHHDWWPTFTSDVPASVVIMAAAE